MTDKPVVDQVSIRPGVTSKRSALKATAAAVATFIGYAALGKAGSVVVDHVTETIDPVDVTLQIKKAFEAAARTDDVRLILPRITTTELPFAPSVGPQIIERSTEYVPQMAQIGFTQTRQIFASREKFSWPTLSLPSQSQKIFDQLHDNYPNRQFRLADGRLQMGNIIMVPPYAKGLDYVGGKNNQVFPAISAADGSLAFWSMSRAFSGESHGHASLYVVGPDGVTQIPTDGNSRGYENNGFGVSEAGFIHFRNRYANGQIEVALVTCLPPGTAAVPGFTDYDGYNPRQTRQDDVNVNTFGQAFAEKITGTIAAEACSLTEVSPEGIIRVVIQLRRGGRRTVAGVTINADQSTNLVLNPEGSQDQQILLGITRGQLQILTQTSTDGTSAGYFLDEYDLDYRKRISRRQLQLTEDADEVDLGVGVATLVTNEVGDEVWYTADGNQRVKFRIT